MQSTDPHPQVKCRWLLVCGSGAGIRELVRGMASARASRWSVNRRLTNGAEPGWVNITLFVSIRAVWSGQASSCLGSCKPPLAAGEAGEKEDVPAVAAM